MTTREQTTYCVHTEDDRIAALFHDELALRAPGVRRRIRHVPMEATKAFDFQVHCAGVSWIVQTKHSRKPPHPDTLAQWMHLCFLGDASPQRVVEWVTAARVRSPDRVYVSLRATDREIRGVLGRLIEGLARDHDDTRIVDATWDAGELLVTNHRLEKLRISMDVLQLVRPSASLQSWSEFELDRFGEFVYWPANDTHMGWTELQQCVDPGARLKAEQQSEAFNKRYGQAIRELREEMGLAQSAIDGLTDRTVRRIERGETRATSKALAMLAAAHGMPLKDYLDELATRI